jgi:hypothetical protein
MGSERLSLEETSGTNSKSLEVAGVTSVIGEAYRFTRSGASDRMKVSAGPCNYAGFLLREPWVRTGRQINYNKGARKILRSYMPCTLPGRPSGDGLDERLHGTMIPKIEKGHDRAWTAWEGLRPHTKRKEQTEARWRTGIGLLNFKIV